MCWQLIIVCMLQITIFIVGRITYSLPIATWRTYFLFRLIPAISVWCIGMVFWCNLIQGPRWKILYKNLNYTSFRIYWLLLISEKLFIVIFLCTLMTLNKKIIQVRPTHLLSPDHVNCLAANRNQKYYQRKSKFLKRKARKVLPKAEFYQTERRRGKKVQGKGHLTNESIY